MMLREIHEFMYRHCMPASTFGRLAVKDPRLVGDLRSGRELRSKTVARVRAFMEGWE